MRTSSPPNANRRTQPNANANENTRTQPNANATSGYCGHAEARGGRASGRHSLSGDLVLLGSKYRTQCTIMHNARADRAVISRMQEQLVLATSVHCLSSIVHAAPPDPTL